VRVIEYLFLKKIKYIFVRKENNQSNIFPPGRDNKGVKNNQIVTKITQYQTVSHYLVQDFLLQFSGRSVKTV